MPYKDNKVKVLIRNYLNSHETFAILELYTFIYSKYPELERKPKDAREKLIEYNLNEIMKETPKSDKETQKRPFPGNSDSTPTQLTPRKLDFNSRKKANTSGNDQINLDNYVFHPTTNFDNLAGIDNILNDIKELIEYPIFHPEIYRHLGVQPPRGILLYGPPGCGKTVLAHAIAGELKLPLIKISSPEIVSGMSGESEEKIRQFFDLALSIAPSILFFDEVDAIFTKRDSNIRGMERRIVAQLLSCMDNLQYSDKDTQNNNIIVIGATNRPDSLDIGLRRAGRFDREISIGIPDYKSREAILRNLLKTIRISDDVDVKQIAECTPGFVGADLQSLVNEAAIVGIHRIFESSFADAKFANDRTNNEPLHNDSDDNFERCGINTQVNKPDYIPKDKKNENIPSKHSSSSLTNLDLLATTDDTICDNNRVINHTHSFCGNPHKFILRNSAPLTQEQLQNIVLVKSDFDQAIEKVQPSAQREGFATIPDVKFSDIGGLENIQLEIILSIVQPIKKHELFQTFGISMPCGILLYGPPGCGKTLLAKAVANESNANFISVKGPEILNKYVGESEKAVRQLFTRARASAPCIIFFDEIDAICPRRNINSENGVSERLVNQLLTEMDGLDGRKNVFIIAATNRPDILDPAMIRPGRLDKLLYVPLPDKEERYSILKTITRNMPIHPEVDLRAIAYNEKCNRFSGADLACLVRESAINALRPLLLSKPDDILETPKYIEMNHLEASLNSIQASVSEKDHKSYISIKNSLRGKRIHTDDS